MEAAKAMIFTDYRGMKVSELNDLRSKLRKEQSSLKVVKNRLMKLVLKAHGLENLSTTSPAHSAYFFRVRSSKPCKR